jgi:hypothetical protein
MARQPDGPGLRIEKRGEISGIGKLTPDGARLFRERVAQFQAEAAYWENRIGTVHDFRMFLFDNDTRMIFTIVFDGDFKAYIVDIFSKAGPWLDGLFLGVWEGYKGSKDPGLNKWLLTQVVSAEFFYAAFPEITRRDVEKSQKLSSAVTELLDAAS